MPPVIPPATTPLSPTDPEPPAAAAAPVSDIHGLENGFLKFPVLLDIFLSIYLALWCATATATYFPFDSKILTDWLIDWSDWLNEIVKKSENFTD